MNSIKSITKCIIYDANIPISMHMQKAQRWMMFHCKDFLNGFCHSTLNINFKFRNFMKFLSANNFKVCSAKVSHRSTCIKKSKR